jgi:hypothetical protein
MPGLTEVTQNMIVFFGQQINIGLKTGLVAGIIFTCLEITVYFYRDI